MPPTRNQDESLLSGRQDRVENRVDNMQDRISKLEAKVTGALILQTVNLMALSFILAKLFELSSKIPTK